MLVVILALTFMSVNGQSCTLGRTDLQPTSPLPFPGLFIQDHGLASCDGEIVRWTVCYYNPRNFSSQGSFPISLEVWRSVRVGELQFVDSNSVTVVVPSQVDNFQCTEFEVDPNSRIRVQKSDYLAVFLPSRFVLPVLTFDARETKRIMYFLESAPIPPASVFLNDVRNLVGYVLYITATISNSTLSSTTTTGTFAGSVMNELSNDTTDSMNGSISVINTPVVLIAVTTATLFMVGCIILAIAVALATAIMVKKRTAKSTERVVIPVGSGSEEQRTSNREDISIQQHHSQTSNGVDRCNTDGESYYSFTVRANIAYGSKQADEELSVGNRDDIVTSFNVAYSYSQMVAEEKRHVESKNVPDNEITYDYI